MITDDLGKACEKASAILRTIYNERMACIPPFKIEDDPLYNEIVGDRIRCLMEEILSKKPRDF